MSTPIISRQPDVNVLQARVKWFSRYLSQASVWLHNLRVQRMHGDIVWPSTLTLWHLLLPDNQGSDAH